MTEKKTRSARITSPDLNAKRLAELRRIMPDLFTGDGQLDEQAVRQLATPDHTGLIEKFRFDWAGKQASKRGAFTPSRATLVADKTRSVDFDTTKNLMIEADNLEVLKLLQASYFEEVKCIYIDPPYNTGNDFIYPDNYTDEKKAYWEKNGAVQGGVKLVANPESNGRRHSNWLNMMQSRLLLARNLLRPDGVIFISIDDNEVHHLRRLCDEIFGEESFVAQIVAQTNPRGRSLDPFLAKTFEYIICYTKKNEPHSISKIPKREQSLREYNKWDEKSKYRLLELRNRNPAFNRKNRPNLYYPIYVDEKTGRVSLKKTKDFSNEALPLNSKGEEGCWTWSKIKFENENDTLLGKKTKTGVWRVYRKDYLPENGAFTKEKSLWLDKEINHENGKEEIARLFKTTGNSSPFDFPKSVDLISKCLRIGSSDGDIIMDFFAGSGTTAHAVMTQNAEDGGSRRFIAVQIPEYIDENHQAFNDGYKTISDVCIERIKRAGRKIKTENPNTSIDTGFRVYRLTDSYFPENLFKSDPDKSEAENLAALKRHLEIASQANLFDEKDLDDIITELSLKNGYGLFFTLTPLHDDFPENKVYRLSGHDRNVLLCLDAELKQGTVETLTANHTEDQVILSKYALDTAKNWTLQNAFRDNLRVV